MSDEPQLTPDADETDSYWQEPTRESEYIASAYNAIMAVQEVDMTLLGKQYEAMKVRVIKKCLRIVVVVFMFTPAVSTVGVFL